MRILSILFLLFAFIMPDKAQALTGSWQETENASLRLIYSTHVDDKGTVYGGLHLKLKPRWHAYWRSPGDAGFPPTPEWKEATNLDRAELLFPWPKRSAMQGLETFGYEDEVVFPLKISLKDAAQPSVLKTKVTFLVCDDICLPAEFNVGLDIPASYATPQGGDDATMLLQAALKRVPQMGGNEGLDIKSTNLVEENGKQILVVVYASAAPLSDAELILEVGDGSTVAYAEKMVLAGQNTIRAVLADTAPKDLGGKEYVFTLIDEANGLAIEKKLPLESVKVVAGEGTLTPRPAHPAFVEDAPKPATSNLWLMIVFALIGGLILNLMPCVLPVLALKSLAFVSHGGGTPSGVRLSFLATSAGILFSFLIMAFSLIGLKEAGMSVGWGVQFQHPIFLFFLIAVLVLFALNLWGLFEIPLPRFLADRLNWTEGHGNLLKDFFSGAFATLLATPCTAPFLGTAIGFALAGNDAEILAIFMALGFGLAMPFILIALFPRTATLLPKPGAWMIVMKKIMAAFLLLTAAWLGFVLMQQLKPTHAEEMGWKAFDESQIPELVQDGKIVFVDVTADWCLTCKANKKFVLERDDMKKLLAHDSIVLMKADWTKPDQKIASFLENYGRFGIPFNIIYGPSAPKGVTLPELLNEKAVREGLEKAGLKP